MKVRLFHRELWKVLKERDAALVDSLSPFAEWYRDLSKLRDPGAHRIPIYAVPGVMDQRAGEEAQRLYSKGEELLRGGKFHDGMGLLDQGYKLATYQPLIALSHDGRTEFRDLVKEVRRDDENFVSAADLILKRLFKGTTSDYLTER